MGSWVCACCRRGSTPNNRVVSFNLRGGLLILCMTCWHDTIGIFLDGLSGEDTSRGMH